MPDYKQGRIYKIVSPCGLTYYGSTTMRLWDRMRVHHVDIKKGKNCSSKRVIEAGGEIYLVEMYPCNSQEELRTREAWYIRYRPCVNENIPNRTQKEYYQDTKQHKKEYYQNNKRKQIEYCKSYYQDNKEKISAQKKEYYENNKQKIKARLSQKYHCECGGKYTHNHRTRHFKTQKHRLWVENNQN